MLQLRYVFWISRGHLSSHVLIARRMNSTSIAFSAAGFASAFSGLLAAAIIHMDGVGGRPGWAWVFILVSLARSHSARLIVNMHAGRTLHCGIWDHLVLPPAERAIGYACLGRRREGTRIALVEE